MAGNEEDAEIGLLHAKAFGEDGTGEVGHDDVGEEQVDAGVGSLKCLDGAPPSIGEQDAVSGGKQDGIEEGEDVAIIVDGKDRAGVLLHFPILVGDSGVMVRRGGAFGAVSSGRPGDSNGAKLAKKGQ